MNFFITIGNLLVILYILTFLHVFFKKPNELQAFIKKTYKLIIFSLFYIYIIYNNLLIQP